MNKKEFIESLRGKLKNLPKEEVDERVNFYIEMIDDRIEDGYTEEEAIRDIGTTDEVSKEIISKIPLKKIIQDTAIKVKNKRTTGEIVALVLGFPLWFPLLISLFAVILSLYISGWAIIISLFASSLALEVGFIGGLILGIIYLANGGLAVILGFSIVSGGLGVLLFFGTFELTKLFIKLTKKMVVGFKSFLVGKER